MHLCLNKFLTILRLLILCISSTKAIINSDYSIYTTPNWGNIRHILSEVAQSDEGFLHLLALLLKFHAEGVGPFGHAEELLLLHEGIIVPLSVVVVGEITLVVAQGITREVLVVVDTAKPVVTHHLAGKCLVREITQEVVVLQYAPNAKPLVLSAYQLYHVADGVLQVLHIDRATIDCFHENFIVER